MSSLSKTVAEIERLKDDLQQAENALKRIENLCSGETIQLSFKECHLDLGYRNYMTIGDLTKKVIEQAINADSASHLKQAIETMEADIAERKEAMLIQAARFVAGKECAQ
ncbi:hypothetical protein ACQU0X_30820 [Pseudovibrio ascidiaceicola]|uniref:hypothetical protein n=1 Tax=Pseudovibrio ascidiaceicola TaxID=285279 RepID=UPI003D35C0FA